MPFYESPPTTFSVYGLVRGEEEVGYIGVAKDPPLRFRQHRASSRQPCKNWLKANKGDVRIWVFGFYAYRPYALRHEAELLRAHKPALNTHLQFHNPLRWVKTTRVRIKRLINGKPAHPKHRMI